MVRILVNIVATVVGGLLVIGVMRIFVTVDWLSFCFAFLGALLGSLLVDLFRIIKARKKAELHDDVVQIIDKIYAQNSHGYNPMEIGYIRAKGWTVPLTHEQEIQMKKVLYVSVENN